MQTSLAIGLTLMLGTLGAASEVGATESAAMPSPPAFPDLSERELEAQPLRLAETPEAEGAPMAGFEPRPKDPRAAFFLSALLPGLGQVYTGSKLRSLPYFAAEAFSWIWYGAWRKEGSNLEEEFEAFADEHWHYDESGGYRGLTYVGYKEFVWNNDPTLIFRENPTREDSLRAVGTHNLEATFTSVRRDDGTVELRDKDQQYYELIGKYDQFVWGWDDIDPNEVSYVSVTQLKEDSRREGKLRDEVHNASQRRFEYEALRKDSNDALNRANIGLWVALGNRVFSAIDAALMAKRVNEGSMAGEIEGRLRVRLAERGQRGEREALLVLSKRF